MYDGDGKSLTTYRSTDILSGITINVKLMRSDITGIHI